MRRFPDTFFRTSSAFASSAPMPPSAMHATLLTATNSGPSSQTAWRSRVATAASEQFWETRQLCVTPHPHAPLLPLVPPELERRMRERQGESLWFWLPSLFGEGMGERAHNKKERPTDGALLHAVGCSWIPPTVSPSPWLWPLALAWPLAAVVWLASALAQC